MTVTAQKVLPSLLEEKEQEALEYLRKFEPPEGYALAYSGGKDSEVLFHLKTSESDYRIYSRPTGVTMTIRKRVRKA